MSFLAMIGKHKVMCAYIAASFAVGTTAPAIVHHVHHHKAAIVRPVDAPPMIPACAPALNSVPYGSLPRQEILTPNIPYIEAAPYNTPTRESPNGPSTIYQGPRDSIETPIGPSIIIPSGPSVIIPSGPIVIPTQPITGPPAISPPSKPPEVSETPEPTIWIELIIGFGLIGTILRKKEPNYV